MKLTQLPMIVAGILVAGMLWILVDMSRAPKAPSAPAGKVEAAIRISTKSRPVMVEFFADWCGPCRTVGPVVDEFAREMAGKASVFRVNVDENHGLAQQYGVRSIPAFIVFKGGEPVSREAGIIPKSRMRSMLFD